MFYKAVVAGIAASLIAGAGINASSAQSYGGAPRAGGYGQGDQGNFWADAPRSPRQRIDWLQQRINRGVDSGNLNRSEARTSQTELDSIRRMAGQFTRRDGGELSPRHADLIQNRLDNLSQRIRWQRDNRYNAVNAGPPPRDSGDRFATQYDAAHDYRDGPIYQERRLSANDQVYRGSDGRYYCKRSDGTTGLVVGAVGGGVLGNVIDGGHNRVAGTLIGGALGALAGKAIDQSSDARCK